MKLFRFMSREEFFKYIHGEKLVNNTNHNKDRNFKSNSIGFCFFNYAHYNPEEIYHSVTGIVSDDICCIFETDKDNVKLSRGRYSKAYDKNSNRRDSFIAKEYCTIEYSKETFKLLKCAIPNWFNWEKWNWKEL